MKRFNGIFLRNILHYNTKLFYIEYNTGYNHPYSDWINCYMDIPYCRLVTKRTTSSVLLYSCTKSVGRYEKLKPIRFKLNSSLNPFILTGRILWRTISGHCQSVYGVIVIHNMFFYDVIRPEELIKDSLYSICFFQLLDMMKSLRGMDFIYPFCWYTNRNLENSKN